MMQQTRWNCCTHTTTTNSLHDAANKEELLHTHSLSDTLNSTHDAANNSTEELPDSQDIRKSQVATRLTILPLNLLHTMTQFTTYNDYAARPAVLHCTPRASFTATHRNSLQHTALQELPLLQPLQHTATHCNTLQHTATHCNTLLRKSKCRGESVVVEVSRI